MNSHRKLEPMVPIRRPGLHHCCVLYGPDYDPGYRLSLLRTVTKKVGLVPDLGLHDVLQCHCISVVLLGLLARLQQHGHQRLHWRLAPLRTDEHPRRAIPWLSPDSRVVVLVLPGTLWDGSAKERLNLSWALAFLPKKKFYRNFI